MLDEIIASRLLCKYWYVIVNCGILGCDTSIFREEMTLLWDGGSTFPLNTGNNLQDCVTTEKTIIDIFTAVRTSNLTDIQI
jgi:hypothetical protein